MDLLGELEAMANTAILDIEVAATDIQLWQKLFGYTTAEAQREIEAYRGDFSKRSVSEEHWELVRQAKESLGYDIEAYSYSLGIKRSSTPKNKNVAGNVNAMYIVKLEGPISSPEQVQEVAGLSHLPVKSTGQGETGDACFCTTTSSARSQLLQWLDTHHPTYTPTIVKLSRSRKELSPLSLAPFLGMETTLPHQRANTNDFEPSPRQDEYPVWYFFYGRLLEPELLKRQLGLTKEPVYRPAQIQGAKMRSWQAKYKAVIDGSEDDFVGGDAFLVENAEWEDSLRFFETDMYEVVRCGIQMMDGEGEEVFGLVFRFCGANSELI